MFKAINQDTKEVAALKIFDIASPEERALRKGESKMLEELKHPNIMASFGFEESLEVNLPDKKTSNACVLIMELASEGEFFRKIEDLGTLSETIARTFFGQIVSAIGYLHEKRIAHLDLKLENLLLCADNVLKVGDFGNAIRLSEGQTVQGLAGTLRFQPPEALEGRDYSPFAADIFALGIILFVMVQGCLPFGTAERSDPFYGLIYSQDIQGFWDLHHEQKKKTGKFSKKPSREFKELFISLVNPDPQKRMNVKEIMTSDWLMLETVDAESLAIWMNTKKKITARREAFASTKSKTMDCVNELI